METPDIVDAIAIRILCDGLGIFQKIIPGPIGRRFGQTGVFQN